MQRIMIIRHGEKHRDGGVDRGVNIDGIHTKHELTVRGWQRAGALVRFFVPVHGHPPGSPISAPAAIFASAATEFSPSLRAQHTVEPLAELLGLGIDTSFAEGEERFAAAAMLAAPSPVLVAWHHNHIARLVVTIAGSTLPCPPAWPDERFDLVWVLDRLHPGAEWTLSQVPQLLFATDSAMPIEFAS